MSQMKDAQAEIDDLKISMDDAIVIHALNNFDFHFRPYLTILKHEARQKAQLPTLSKITKTLEDEELRLKNENTASANFAKKAKSRSAGHKNSEKKSGKDSTNQKKEECKTCGGSHSGECWHLTAECFQCHQTGHISANCPDKEKKGSTSLNAPNQKPSRTSKNLTPKGKVKKMSYVFCKITLKEQRQQPLALINNDHQLLQSSLTQKLQIISLPTKT